MDEFQSSPSHKKKRMVGGVSNQTLGWVALIVLLLIAVGVAVFFYKDSQDKQKQVQKLSNPTEQAKLEQQQLMAKVGLLTVLPAGETPTVATVTDITKLQDQAFFANAQNGDKVLIYTKAKKAILYRPSTNKIINIAPVNIGSGNTPSTSQTNR